MKKRKRKEIGLKDLHGYIVCSPDQKKAIKEEVMDPLGEALKSIQFADDVKSKTKKK
ncbi:MAG TPA: hypothetical protein VJC08_01000 [bacterium]|nr:hypothetical protein [bacterium]